MIRVKTGDHNGRFALPSGEEVNGTLTLGADRPPSVSLHPDDPGEPTGIRSFPRDSRASELVGYLFSNDEVIIGDVYLSEWFLRQVMASGRWALVGLNITQVPDRRWSTLEVRITGLETVLGNAITATAWPMVANVEPQRFSADLNTAANYASTGDDVTVWTRYLWSFQPSDPYRFSVSNFATATFVADQPRTVDEWVNQWMNPLLGLVTLATGEREHINSALFSAPDPTRTADHTRFQAEIQGQLFGAGIHQQNTPAERRTRANGAPLVPLFTLADAPPLADLIRAWRTNLGERPATALYRLSMDPTLPSSVRYLLCAQALESFHAEDHAEHEESEDEAYAKDFTAAISSLIAIPDDVLDSSVKRFLKKNVRRTPPRSLANRIHQVLAAIPDHKTLTRTWVERTEPLVPQLTALGYLTEPLAERLGSIRNVLSHGSATLPGRPVHAASRILETLLRGQFLSHLGFNEQQLVDAYAGMTNAHLIG
jgi:hypothetical protein